MSAADIDSGFDLAATRGGPDEISRRLESLPASSYLWRLVILLSLGGWFEVYDLFFTGYIAPGLNRSGLLTTTTRAFFGFFGDRCLCRGARASGLIYSMSRVSATVSGFIVAYVLREAGVGGVFGLITSAMIVVIVAIATFGPNVRGKPLDA
jgi:hypothetical protein